MHVKHCKILCSEQLPLTAYFVTGVPAAAADLVDIHRNYATSIALVQQNSSEQFCEQI